MLKRVDRVQIAVKDLNEAEGTLTRILGATKVGEDELSVLAARRTTMQAGASLIELLEPSGPGAAADHIQRWREGLFAAGLSVDDLDAMARRLERFVVRFEHEGDQLFIDPTQTKGMRTVVSRFQDRQPVGLIKWIYEVTNVVDNWIGAANRYEAIFGLERSRFVPITSKEFGYTGSLLMFDSPARLDRIELAQVTEPDKPMGRFHTKRSDSLYMFFVETDDVDSIATRLEGHGDRFTKQTDAVGTSGIFIHPTALCGTLVGVSRTENAWLWSGDPERASRAATAR